MALSGVHPIGLVSMIATVIIQVTAQTGETAAPMIPVLKTGKATHRASRGTSARLLATGGQAVMIKRLITIWN